VKLSRPSRDGKKLLELLRRGVEGERDGATEGGKGRATELRSLLPLRRSVASSLRRSTSPPSIDDYNGFIGLRLHVTRAESISTEQITLNGGAAFESRIELDDLVERLSVRLGDDAVVQAQSVESFLPEKAVRFTRDDRDESRREQVEREWINPQAPHPPLCLRPPTEIRVTVAPSHDRDGRPVQIIDPVRRYSLPIAHSTGPTRVAGQWWTGHDKSRDYFDVELPDGKRWWVFRVNETGRWFWQGEY
jgi:hypothetical protein